MDHHKDINDHREFDIQCNEMQRLSHKFKFEKTILLKICIENGRCWKKDVNITIVHNLLTALHGL